ncbi:MAG: Urease operon accessory protein [Rhizobium sp.]
MGRRIVIVGNGEVPQGAAEAIDDADLVVRFNECRNFGSSGSRTDVVAVCNTGRPAFTMLSSPEWRASRPVADCREIWSVRDPEKFRALLPELMLTHPELADFCDDYTDALAAFAGDIGKTHVIIDRSVHEAVDAALMPFDPGDYVVPSSGMVVVASILAQAEEAGDTVFLTGFSHQGWDGHPFAAERRLVDFYIGAGKLTRLSQADFISPSQGV